MRPCINVIIIVFLITGLVSLLTSSLFRRRKQIWKPKLQHQVPCAFSIFFFYKQIPKLLEYGNSDELKRCLCSFYSSDVSSDVASFPRLLNGLILSTETAPVMVVELIPSQRTRLRWLMKWSHYPTPSSAELACIR